MKISREVKTAILVISGILLMVFLVNYLSGLNIFDSNNTYKTEFEYNSLTQSSPVTIKGNVVGKIKEIYYDVNSGRTIVEFSVKKDLEFSKNSIVRMYETGLMGGNALAIIPAEGGEKAENGDVLKSEVEMGLITNLTKNFSGISSDLGVTLKSADSLLININNLVSDDSDQGLKNAISELNLTVASFKDLSQSLNKLISNNDEKLTSVIGNFDSISHNLAIISSDLKNVKFSETVAELDKSLATVNTLMSDLENGKGSIGKLLTDDGLYQNLEGASKQLEQLLQDMKLNPKRYVHFSLFGKKPGAYNAEKNESKDQN